jgi:ATP-dependent exoDNAse (exonuclease V) beta subunit
MIVQITMTKNEVFLLKEMLPIWQRYADAFVFMDDGSTDGTYEFLSENKEKYNILNILFFGYAIFHKSEEGNSINLADSENSTRIVSIHTSKGDGRNVVFVIGLDEGSLLKFSNEKNNLVCNQKD